jgi:four helix bundle protein
LDRIPQQGNSQYKSERLKARSKSFAIRIVQMFRSLPKTDEAKVIGRQVLRSGTSAAANYRAACRARSKPEFLSKISVVVEEIDETVFWLEMLIDVGIVSAKRMGNLLDEANELLAIFAASQHTARTNLNTKSHVRIR